MRRFLILLLVCLLPLQSLHAAVDAWLDAGDDQHEMHWVEHEHGVAHHHLDNGQVQHDDSDESQQHMDDHALCHVATAVLTSAPITFAHQSVDDGPMPLPELRPSDPDLETPIRPPQTRLSCLSI